MNRIAGSCSIFRILLLLLLVVGIVCGHSDNSLSARSSTSDKDALQNWTSSFFGNLLSRTAKDISNGKSLGSSRTFGQKRIQFMIMPLIYKMGVIVTMLIMLTVISLKGLAIGVILLVLKLSALFGKFYALWDQHKSGGYHGHSGWQPPPQPVHVHLHGAHNQVYSGWESPGPSPSGPYF